MSGSQDLVNGDAGHAAKVDRTFPEETRAAADWMLDDPRLGAEGTGGNLAAGPEDRDLRNIERGGEVHGAGVVRDEQAALLDQSHERPKTGPARQNDRGPFHLSCHFLRDLALVSCAEDHDPYAVFLREPVGGRRVSI